MPERAPIVLFTYNRPRHTEATLRALAANELARESDLTVFCDGPKTGDQQEATDEVRAVARAASGFRSVRVVERHENLGLAGSVIRGIDEMLSDHETVIVMEDDLVTAPGFLRYMNDGLRRYADAERVISICGYTFPVAGRLPETFFLPGAFCWGWGTWRRSWALLERDPRKALDQIVARDLIYEFDFQGSDPLTLILQATVLRDARADSWATRWMATACLHDKLTLYPGRSLVLNIGFDGTGRHATHDSRYETPLAEQAPPVGTSPAAPDPSAVAAHRSLFLGWRTEGSPKRKAFFRATGWLPRAAEKRIYNALVRRWLRKGEALGRSVLGH